MQKLLRIYTVLRPYRILLVITFVLSLILIALLVVIMIETNSSMVLNEHSTAPQLSSTPRPLLHSSCQMSNASSPIPCGCPSKSSSKIVNGQTANPGAWPWMVSYGPKRLHVCGGALIAPEYILTAAHCFHGRAVVDLSAIEIRIGLSNLTGVTHDHVFSIRKVTLHNDFNPNTYKNDIAIIRLDRSIVPSDTIQLICLPRLSSFQYPPVNQSVVAIGWGHTVDPWINSSSSISNQLQQTILPVLPIVTNANKTSVCLNQVIDSPDQQFCAGYADGWSDTCQADSGSPLMFFHEQHWEVAGIVSYGIGCAQSLLPGIYTRVSAYLEWINDRIHYY